MFVNGRTPPRARAIPDAQVREIAKRVMRDARVQHAMKRHGIRNGDEIVQKALAPFVVAMPNPRLVALEAKLSKETDILKRADIEREIAFAKAGGAR